MGIRANHIRLLAAVSIFKNQPITRVFPNGEIISITYLQDAIQLDPNYGRAKLSAFVAKDQEVVIYACGPGCGTTTRAVASAVSMGFNKVYFFRAGRPPGIPLRCPLNDVHDSWYSNRQRVGNFHLLSLASLSWRTPQWVGWRRFAAVQHDGHSRHQFPRANGALGQSRPLSSLSETLCGSG